MKNRILTLLILVFVLALVGLGGCSSSSTIPPAPEPLEPRAPEVLATPTSGGQGSEGSGGQGEGKEGTQGHGQGSGSSESEGADGEADSQSGAKVENGSQSPQGSTGETAPSGPSTAGERTSAADERLQEALGEFDQLINGEQREASREASEKPTRSGGGTGEQDIGASGGTRGDEDEAGADSGGAVGSGGLPEGENSDRVPADVGNGSGDDIVARQLREAAVNEEDPELRERLWDEYRAYKRSIEGGR